MKKRNWVVEEKLAIVLEGLKEKRSVAEICREHQISQRRLSKMLCMSIIILESGFINLLSSIGF